MGQKPPKASTQASGMGQSHVRCLPQLALSLTLRIWLITGSDQVTVGRNLLVNVYIGILSIHDHAGMHHAALTIFSMRHRGWAC